VAFPRTLLEDFDTNGNLPIHVAASVNSRLGGKKKRTIEILLAACPRSAQIRNRQQHGGHLLPLELVLASGKKWEKDGMAAILAAYPEAAGHRHPDSGKFPLQQALERGPDCVDAAVPALLAAYGPALHVIAVEDDAAAPLLLAGLPMSFLAASCQCSTTVVYTLLRSQPAIVVRRRRDESQTAPSCLAAARTSQVVQSSRTDQCRLVTSPNNKQGKRSVREKVTRKCVSLESENKRLQQELVSSFHQLSQAEKAKRRRKK
jgi:hypothetical protein